MTWHTSAPRLQFFSSRSRRLCFDQVKFMRYFGRTLGFGCLLLRVALAGMLWVLPAVSAETNTFFRGPGTIRMAERLAEWARTEGERNPFDNTARLKAVKQRLATDLHPAERFKAEALLASLLLNAGEPRESVLLLSNLLVIASSPASDITLDRSSHHQ